MIEHSKSSSHLTHGNPEKDREIIEDVKQKLSRNQKV